MKVHCFQHVPFEGLGSMEQWLKSIGARVSTTKFYDQPYLPGIEEIDWLIVMGGPMSVNDEGMLPWLRTERQFIAEAIAREKVVLGICLGAQLIASAMGAAVYRNPVREIGWFPVERVADSQKSTLATFLPPRAEVFHWHGETFDLPADAVRIARSEACENQGFSIGDRVLGLQFHLETTPSSLNALVENCRSEIIPGRFIQSEEEMKSGPERFQHINAMMSALLDHLAGLSRQT